MEQNQVLSLKSNIDTQNGAMFEAGDASKNSIILGIYVRFLPRPTGKLT